MPILNDGTVIPSYLGVNQRGSSKGSRDILNDYVFRMGEVKKLIYPNDPLSYGKKTVEYEIEVQYRNKNGTYVTSVYRGVTVSTMFGGIADRFHATFRPDTNSSGSQASVGTGSKVLILCLSGDQQKAIILGGVEDPLGTRTESSSTGHNLYFEFNGLSFSVDKDGQAKVTYKGATQADGTLDQNANANASGSFVLFDKDGSITVSDTAQSIMIDKKNKKINIIVDQEWNVKVNGKLQFTVDKDIDIVSSGGAVEIDAQGNVTIKSAGVLVGAATDNWILGTTYRQAEGIKDDAYAQSLESISEAAITAATALGVAAGLNSIPVYGGAMAASAFEDVAAELATIGAMAGVMAGATETFNGGASGYLSKVNKSD